MVNCCEARSALRFDLDFSVSTTVASNSFGTGAAFPNPLDATVLYINLALSQTEKCDFRKNICGHLKMLALITGIVRGLHRIYVRKFLHNGC